MLEVKESLWKVQLNNKYPIISTKSDAACSTQGLNPICTGDFGSYMTRGGQICPHPLKMGVMCGRFKK